MFVIIVYDVSVERVTKVCHFLRRYLNWMQNSLFEGELTETELREVMHSLKKIIEPSKDSVRIYTVRTEEIVNIENLGVLKTDTSPII